MEFVFTPRLPTTPGNGPSGASEGLSGFASGRQSRRVETPDDASSVGSMASSREQNRRCYKCRELAIPPSQPLVKCEVCKARYHCSCHQPTISDYSKPFTCSRCRNQAIQKTPPFSSGSRLSTTTPRYDAVPSLNGFDSLNRGQPCSNPGCQIIVQTLSSNPDGTLLCKQHEIANKHKSASAQSSSHKPHIHSRHIQNDKQHLVRPGGQPLLKRQRSATAKTGTQHDSNLQTSNADDAGSSRQATRDEPYRTIEYFGSTAIRQQAAGSSSSREIRTSKKVEKQNKTTASFPTAAFDGSPMSLSFITEHPGSDRVNVITPFAPTPPQYVFHASVTRSNGGSFRAHDNHETSEPRLLSGHNSWPINDQITNTPQAIDNGKVISNQFPVLPGLGADETADIHGDLHKPSDEEISGNIPSMNTQENSEEQNSTFTGMHVRSQYITPTDLHINSHDRLKPPRSVADPDHHTSIQENVSKMPQNTYEVHSEREEFVDPAASNTPSLRPLVSTSLRSSEEATQVPQAPQIYSGARTNLKSRPKPGDKLRSLLACTSPRSPRSYSADSSLEAESDDYYPAQVVGDYDSSNLDAYLMAQAKPKSRRQPNAQELVDTQIWAHIDPRNLWAPERPASWYEEKCKEIAARGGKKANLGKVITAQNRKERSEKGWNIHQSRESNFGTPEDLERIRMVEDMIGVEDIKDMVPAVVDGVLCVVDAPGKDDDSLHDSQREVRPPRCFPL